MKFKPGALARYLREPEANYRWNRMPNFRLSASEADDLAAYLTGNLKQTVEAAPAAREIEMGKKLVESSGCLNCHSANCKEGVPFAELD
jgi:mono/diheme cytochrome c family protein